MDRRFLLKSESSEVQLRTIASEDCENLRRWKNTNRHAFFHRDILSSEDQARWFGGYLHRPDDYMFVVVAPPDIGCMGFRLEGGKVDVYNVIRGENPAGRRGQMRDALLLMCGFALETYRVEIGCKVLVDNPAVAWYEGCGFWVQDRKETYLEMVLREEFAPPLVQRIPLSHEGRG